MHTVCISCSKKLIFILYHIIIVLVRWLDQTTWLTMYNILHFTLTLQI